MTKAERWKAVEDLFHRALDVSEGERNAFLQAESGGDAELIEGLRAGEFAACHQDAHRDPDLPVGLQRAGQMIGRVMAARGEDRPGRG